MDSTAVEGVTEDLTATVAFLAVGMRSSKTSLRTHLRARDTPTRLPSHSSCRGWRNSVATVERVEVTTAADSVAAAVAAARAAVLADSEREANSEREAEKAEKVDTVVGPVAANAVAAAAAAALLAVDAEESAVAVVSMENVAAPSVGWAKMAAVAMVDSSRPAAHGPSV